MGRCVHVKLHVCSPIAPLCHYKSSECVSVCKVCSAESAAQTETLHDCGINIVLKMCDSLCPLSTSSAVFSQMGVCVPSGVPGVTTKGTSQGNV